MPTETVFETTDLYFAAFLKTAKVPLIKATRGRNNKNEIVFTFDNPADIVKKLEMEFYNRKAKVVAMDLVDEVRALKKLIYANTERNFG